MTIFQKIRRCIILCIICTIIAILAFSNWTNDKFNPKVDPIIPMFNSTLYISQKFTMTETEDGYVYSGSLVNTSEEDIFIDVLWFTFSFKGKITRTPGFMDILVPAQSTYHFYEKSPALAYGGIHDEEDNYVIITIDEQELYLEHSRYSEIQNEYTFNLEQEKIKYDSKQKLTLFIASLCGIATISFAVCAIHFYILYKRDACFDE